MFKINTVYKLLLLLLLLASAAATGWIVYSLDPNSQVNNVILFYASAGSLIMFMTATLLYIFRQRFGVRELARRHFLVSVRQGFLVGLCLVIGLFLQSQGLFTWLNSAFLVAALVFLEIYFIYSSNKTNTKTNLNEESINDR